MNDLYGIDPAAPASVRDVADILKLFRSGEGRFIAACPSNWASVVAKSNRWSDAQKHVVMAYAEQIRRVLLPLRSSVSASVWSENVPRLRSEGVELFFGVDGCSVPINPLSSALEDPNAFADARGDHIPRQIPDYIRAAEPLLMLSTKIVLVDPFFGLWRRNKNTGEVVPDHPRRKVLGALLKRAAQLKRVACFKILLSEAALPDDCDGEDFSREFQRIANGADAGRIELLFEVLEDRDEGDQHARYLLGNYAGLQFDHGFAIDSRPDGKSKNHVHWMSESELAPLLDRFMIENA